MSRGRNLVLGWGLALAAVALFCALGNWQLGRRLQKQEMLDAAARVLADRDARPLALAADAGRTADYDWAAGSGSFAHAPPVLLDNQQRGGRPGVRVYRVFLPEGDAAPLLVELGWLPLPGDRTMPALEPEPGLREVRGLLAAPPSSGLARMAVQEQPDGSLLVTGLDITRLSGPLGVDRLAPRVLRLDPDLPVGHARDLELLSNTLPPERHLGYAVQWFGLALAVLCTALILTFRRGRRPSSSTDSRP